MQAEDELASINMVIGASYGGTPAMTATSGPGMSLMIEAMGLAVAAEIPAVVVNVMRGGPSTGIPTKSEQVDLNIALYGLHGDAPHLVLGALDHADCILTMEWAVRLSEALQTAVIVLSDQNLAQSRVLIPRPEYVLPDIPARSRAEPGEDYQRYRVTDSGVSPMAIPGTPSVMYVADGLEHNESGKPSSAAADHQTQLDKRARKISEFNYGEHWADIRGQGTIAIITWGSTSGAVREAAERLGRDGRDIKVISIRLVATGQPGKTGCRTARRHTRAWWSNKAIQDNFTCTFVPITILWRKPGHSPGPVLCRSVRARSCDRSRTGVEYEPVKLGRNPQAKRLQVCDQAHLVPWLRRFRGTQCGHQGPGLACSFHWKTSP